MLLRVLLLVLSSVESSSGGALEGRDLVIPTDRLHIGSRRFPVRMYDRSFNGINGFASIQFNDEREKFIVYRNGSAIRVNSTLSNGTTSRIIMWSVASASLVVTTGFDVPTNMGELDEENNSIASLSGSLQSNLLRTVDSFVHTPINHTHGQLIVRPVDASVYAHDRQLYYATSQSDTRIIVPVAVRVNPQSSDTPTLSDQLVDADEFTLCFVDYPHMIIHLPNATFLELVTQLISLGVSLQFNPEASQIERMVVRNVTEANIDSLPSLQFIVLTDDEQQVSISTLSPREYIGPENILEDGAERPIWIHTGNRPCSLPSMLVNKIVVHVDRVNRQIGFGEPLNEIF